MLREGIKIVPPTQNLGFLYRLLVVILDRREMCDEADRVVAEAAARLPQELSALARYRTIAQSPFKQVSLEENTEPAANKMLFLATEWLPEHGGLSQLNRSLCCNIACRGVAVTCAVLDFTSAERIDAIQNGVNLIAASTGSGVVGGSRLLLKLHNLPVGYVPDYIIGHGRITGPAAEAQMQFFPAAKRIHFVHMAPDEIEWLKPVETGDVASTAEKRAQIEIDLARSANRAVAIGQRLTERLRRDLSGYEGAIDPFEFVPGFDSAQETPERQPPPGSPFKVLLMCRAEDEIIKGLDIAARALAAIDTAAIGRVELYVRGAKEGTGGDLRARLLAISNNVGVVVRNFSVNVQQLKAELASASLAVMPSRAEGFGLFAAEALIAGTPILISKESGMGALLMHELSQDEFAQVVVGMSGTEADVVERWKTAISAKLSDREGAFAAAHKLKLIFAERFPWRKQADDFLEWMRNGN